MERKIIKTSNAPTAIGPYSQAIEIDGFIFLSGQIPLTKEGELVGSEIKEQTIQVLKNMEEVLLAAGCTLKNVVKTTVYLSDIENFNIVNQIYGEFFNDNPPARSAVQVARLPKDVKIEIEAIAHVKV